ncbi:MAG: hypothetical protein Q8R92_10770 [Deltaproteobacteria bacterium]|nr:hypothetical protein [Deltaproteobacteria bacterium]
MKPRSGAPPKSLTVAVWLCALTFLFFLRVLGQFLVAFFHVSWLPPMEAWMSGLLPYPWLLASQVLILLLQAKICTDFLRGSGYFTGDRRRGAALVQWFAVFYATSMAVRYVLTMSLHPERRWFGGTIPIWFHFVLAAYLLTFSRYHTGRWWPWSKPDREAG